MESTGQSVSGLHLNVQTGKPPVIHAAGELNYQNCEHVHRLIRDLFDDLPCVVCLDLANLDFVDSSGLRVLAVAAIEATKANCTLQIISLSRQLAHALEISQLKGLFDVAVSPEDVIVPLDVCHPLDEKTFELTPVLDSCRHARSAVCEFASAMGFGDEAIDDIRLAVGEAVSNAVRHGCCGPDCVNVCCANQDGHLLVTLRYGSQQFDPDSVPEPDLEKCPEGGMGIHFMRLAMDAVDYEFSDGQVTVTLRKKLQQSN